MIRGERAGFRLLELPVTVAEQRQPRSSIFRRVPGAAWNQRRIVLYLQQRHRGRRAHRRRQPDGKRCGSDDAVLRLREDAGRPNRADVPVRADANGAVRRDLQPAELLDGVDGERNDRPELLHARHHRAGKTASAGRENRLVTIVLLALAATPAFARNVAPDRRSR